MKNILAFALFLVAMLFFISETFAGDATCKTVKSENSVQEKLELKTDVPKWLEGATITVRQKDGKESVVSADKFKVVPRKQQFIVTKTRAETTLMCAGDNHETNKNRVSLLGGIGPSGNLKVSSDGSKVSVETGPAAVGGLQYQRLLTDEISVGGQVQTNQSIMLNVGLDF